MTLSEQEFANIIDAAEAMVGDTHMYIESYLAGDEKLQSEAKQFLHAPKERLYNAITAWNTRAQPRYTLRMNGSEVQKELDALTAQLARQKVGAGDGDTYIGGATVYRKPQPAPAAGDAFSDVLLEQHQGDCIQRINIPNARLVAALPAPSISEDEAVKIMLPVIGNFVYGTHPRDKAKEIYRALLAAGVIRGNV